MGEPRKARKGGPLLWQLKLRIKRIERRLDAEMSASRVKLAATEAAPEKGELLYMNAADISRVEVVWAKFGVTREASRRCCSMGLAPEPSGCCCQCKACPASVDARELPGAVQ